MFFFMFFMVSKQVLMVSNGDSFCPKVGTLNSIVAFTTEVELTKMTFFILGVSIIFTRLVKSLTCFEVILIIRTSI